MVTTKPRLCSAEAHVFRLTYDYRIERWWFRKFYYLRCSHCDLRIEEP